MINLCIISSRGVYVAVTQPGDGFSKNHVFGGDFTLCCNIISKTELVTMAIFITVHHVVQPAGVQYIETTVQ